MSIYEVILEIEKQGKLAALCTIIVSPLSGRLSDRYGWKRFTVAGLFIAAIGLFLLATISIESSLLSPLLWIKNLKTYGLTAKSIMLVIVAGINN